MLFSPFHIIPSPLRHRKQRRNRNEKKKISSRFTQSHRELAWICSLLPELRSTWSRRKCLAQRHLDLTVCILKKESLIQLTGTYAVSPGTGSADPSAGGHCPGATAAAVGCNLMPLCFMVENQDIYDTPTIRHRSREQHVT